MSEYRVCYAVLLEQRCSRFNSTAATIERQHSEFTLCPPPPTDLQVVAESSALDGCCVCVLNYEGFDAQQCQVGSSMVLLMWQ